MRTTLILDDALVETAKRLTGQSKTTAVVHEGLRALIAQRSAARLAELGGSDRKARATRLRGLEEAEGACGMSDAPEAALPPAARVHDKAGMLRAMQRAVREAIWRHKLAGHPVAVWRDERVVWIQPEDIPDSFAPEPNRE